MTGEWKPDNELQLKIYEFWKVRGYDQIKGALGKYQITFDKEYKDCLLGSVELIYLEKFYHHAQMKILDNIIERLSTCEREDALFPLAGREFCDKIIEMLKIVKSEIEK